MSEPYRTMDEIHQLGALGRLWGNPTIAFSKLGFTHLDGLLGLDFFRARILTIDSVRGTIALRRPWRWPLAR